MAADRAGTIPAGDRAGSVVAGEEVSPVAGPATEEMPRTGGGAAERWRVFLDTNVFIAGIASRTGASAAILDLGEAEEILVVVSRQVLVESDRTFLEKFPHLIERYRAFIRNLAPFLADDPSRSRVEQAARVIHPNDAPILAAAKQQSLDYLVTLNTRHFATPRVRAFLPVPIVTPAEFLAAFRAFWQRSASA